LRRRPHNRRMRTAPYTGSACRALAVATVLALSSGDPAAADRPARSAPPADAAAKPGLRGLVSMGAFKFVGSGGDPVNTLEPLEAKPGIFGGIVIIASWAQLQPDGPSPIENGNAIDKALDDVRAYNTRHPKKPLGVRLRVWGGFKAPGWAMKIGG